MPLTSPINDLDDGTRITVELLDSLTPGQCWDAWVGSQTTTDFVGHCGDSDIAEAVNSYVDALPEMMSVEFVGLSDVRLADKLLAYIEWQAGTEPE